MHDPVTAAEHAAAGAPRRVMPARLARRPGRIPPDGAAGRPR